MKYRKDLHNRDWYLNDTRTRKWIVQCLACQQYGRKVNTPKEIPKVNFEENFPIMVLNANGICETCMNAKK